MMIHPTNVYLDTYLEPLAVYLARDDVTDIWINQPGELWLEVLGGNIERHDAPGLTSPLLLRLARQMAAITAQGINREHPILSAALPTGERVQIVIPPATRGEVAIAIRKHVVSSLKLEDYRHNGALVDTEMLVGETRDQRPPLIASQRDPIALLCEGVWSRRNILISGGTSTGKTTFLNALLTEIPDHERLILIEDTPELKLVHENAIGLLSSRSALGEAAITADDLLIASLRMRPDRIILGEIRGIEASTFLRAVNTGHPGSLSTIHADSPLRAIDQLALLVLQTGIRMNWEDVVTYVKRSLNIIVQLKRGKAGRCIETIMVMENAD